MDPAVPACSHRRRIWLMAGGLLMLSWRALHGPLRFTGLLLSMLLLLSCTATCFTTTSSELCIVTLHLSFFASSTAELFNIVLHQSCYPSTVLFRDLTHFTSKTRRVSRFKQLQERAFISRTSNCRDGTVSSTTRIIHHISLLFHKHFVSFNTIEVV